MTKYKIVPVEATDEMRHLLDDFDLSENSPNELYAVLLDIAPTDHNLVMVDKGELGALVHLLFFQSDELKPVKWVSNAVFGHGHEMLDKSSYYVNKDYGFITWNERTFANKCYKVWLSECDTYFDVDFNTKLDAQIFCLKLVAEKFPNSYEAQIYNLLTALAPFKDILND